MTDKNIGDVSGEVSIAEIQYRLKVTYAEAKDILKRLGQNKTLTLDKLVQDSQGSVFDYEVLAVGSIIGDEHRKILADVMAGNMEYDARNHELLMLIDFGVVGTDESHRPCLLWDKTRAEALLCAKVSPGEAERARICMELAHKTRTVEPCRLRELLLELDALPREYYDLILDFRAFLDSREQNGIVTVNGALKSGEIDLILLSALADKTGCASRDKLIASAVCSSLTLFELGALSTEFSSHLERLSDYLDSADGEEISSRLKEFRKRNGYS